MLVLVLRETRSTHSGKLSINTAASVVLAEVSLASNHRFRGVADELFALEEITVDLGRGCGNLLNPLVAAQNFEYKVRSI